MGMDGRGGACNMMQLARNLTAAAGDKVTWPWCCWLAGASSWLARAQARASLLLSVLPRVLILVLDGHVISIL